MGDEANEPTFLEDAKCEVKFSFLPRRCYVTKKTLWLSNAVRGRRTFYTQETVIHDDRWYSKKQFVLMQLKGWC